MLAPGFVAAALLAVSWLSWAGASPNWVVVATAAAFLPYGFLCVVPTAGLNPRVLFAFAALAGATLTLSPPVLSDDVFRFAWDGWVSIHGIDPYRFSPDDPALASLRGDDWAEINHPKLLTVYPPVAQLLFATAASIGSVFQVPTTWVLRLVGVLGHLLVGVTLLRGAGRVLGGYGGAKKACSLYLLNPLALVETAQSGHLDVWVGLALVVAALALSQRRPWRAAMVVAVAIGLKLVGLMALPVLALRQRRAALVAMCLGIALVLPLAVGSAASRGSIRAGLVHYSVRWEGNAGGFLLVRGLASSALSVAAWALSWPEGKVRVGPGDRALPLFRPGLDLLAAGGAKKAQSRPGNTADRQRWANLIARGWVALALLIAAIELARRLPAVLALRWTCLLTLLVLPTVHPWYLLWVLPLELLSGRRAGLIWSAVVLLSYLPLARFQQDRIWVLHNAALVVEYLLVAAAVLVEWQGTRGSTSTAPSV